MRERRLGANGLMVSEIGLGAWPLGGGMGEVDEDLAVATVRAAIDQGITLIDTAQAYRSSEHMIGKALRDGYRDRCFLATKVSGRYSREDVEAAVEHSLHELEVDHVDLFQVHSWNPKYPIEETMEAMERVRERGLTRYIGVSNFDADAMAAAMKTAPFISNQPRYNMFDRGIEERDIGYCRENGIGVLAHSPLAKGLLTGKYSPDHVFADDDERSRFPRFHCETFAEYLTGAGRLEEIAEERGLTLVQLAVAWILRLPEISCVLAGAKNPRQVEEHAAASGIALREDEISAIDRILSEVHPQE